MDNPRQNIDDLRTDINNMPKFDGQTKFYNFSDIVSKNHSENEEQRQDAERGVFARTAPSNTYGATTLGESMHQRRDAMTDIPGVSISEKAYSDKARIDLKARQARQAEARKMEKQQFFKNVTKAVIAGSLAVTAIFGASQVYKAFNNQVPETDYGTIRTDPNGYTSFDSTQDLAAYCDENGIDKSSLEFNVDSAGRVDVSNSSLGITNNHVR